MGQPILLKAGYPLLSKVGSEKETQGSEPSQYLEEEKAKCDSLSSGERNGNSLNRVDANQLGVAGPGV